MAKELSSVTRDPEDFYRSVRKLTENPLPDVSVRNSIRVLQLEGMDSVEWSAFEDKFSRAAQGEPTELSDLFDLHSYDFEASLRKRVVDPEHEEFLSKLLADDRLNSFSRECVLCFLNDWKIVKGSIFDYMLDKGSAGSRRVATVNVDKDKKAAIAPFSPRVPEDGLGDGTSVSSGAPVDPQHFAQATEDAVHAIQSAVNVSSRSLALSYISHRLTRPLRAIFPSIYSKPYTKMAQQKLRALASSSPADI